MLTFTAPNGARVEIDGAEVIRVRSTIYGENPDASTRIDWLAMNLVKETVDVAVGKIIGFVPSLTSLTVRNGGKIWFNAKKVSGPLPIPPNMAEYGYKSSIKLLNYRQYVMEDHEVVRAILAAARQATADSISTG